MRSVRLVFDYLRMTENSCACRSGWASSPAHCNFFFPGRWSAAERNSAILKGCVRLTVQIIAIHAPWRPEFPQSIIILRPSVRTNLPCVRGSGRNSPGLLGEAKLSR